MTMGARILFVDDEVKITNILSRILTEAGYEVSTVHTAEDGLKTAESHRPDIVLMDLHLPGMSGMDCLTTLRQMYPDIVIIMITAFGSIQSAVEAMQKGAYDYITKPFDNNELLMILQRAREHVKLKQEVYELQNQLREQYSFSNIIGRSREIRAVFDLMERVAATDATVLVQGESGTGKELIVRAIHHASLRADGPFVALNCGAIPQNLVESRLFGHEKGAFTDAKSERIGAFEQAEKGTLFLDEISELSLDDQVKLLRALEERCITRVGGSGEIPVDIRIVAATNRDLEQQVMQGAFRQDLFFRLNVFLITIPPLRERKEDIPLLVEHFIKRHRPGLAPHVTDISTDAVLQLQMYQWPGNVRELENAVQSALIVCRQGKILPCHLPLRVQGHSGCFPEEETDDLGLEKRVEQVAGGMEKLMITEALKRNSGSRTRAAEDLQISRKTLFNKMRKLGISGDEYKGA